MSWKNSLLKSLVKFFKKNPKDFFPKRFLIVSTTALGDSLWASPSIHALKNTFPESSIDLLTSPIGKQVFAKNPECHEIWIYKGGFSLLRLFFEMRKKNYDTVIFLHTSQRIILPFCALLGASHIIGNEGMFKGLDSLLTDKFPRIREHEILRRLRLVAHAGAILEEKPQLQFSIEELDRTKASLWWQEQGLGLHVIGIHTGAADPFKLWPLDHFCSLAKELLEIGYQVVFTGSAQEKKTLEAIQLNVPGSIVTIPSLPLHTLAAIMEKFTLFITNDTGPMHLAIAMKTNVLGIFGPTDATLCGPLEVTNAYVLQKNKTCLPCIGKKCQMPLCLRQLSVKEVLEKAKILLDIKSILPKRP